MHSSIRGDLPGLKYRHIGLGLIKQAGKYIKKPKSEATRGISPVLKRKAKTVGKLKKKRIATKNKKVKKRKSIKRKKRAKKTCLKNTIFTST